MSIRVLSGQFSPLSQALVDRGMAPLNHPRRLARFRQRQLEGVYDSFSEPNGHLLPDNRGLGDRDPGPRVDPFDHLLHPGDYPRKRAIASRPDPFTSLLSPGGP